MVYEKTDGEMGYTACQGAQSASTKYQPRPSPVSWHPQLSSNFLMGLFHGKKKHPAMFLDPPIDGNHHKKKPEIEQRIMQHVLGKPKWWLLFFGLGQNPWCGYCLSTDSVYHLVHHSPPAAVDPLCHSESPSRTWGTNSDIQSRFNQRPKRSKRNTKASWQAESKKAQYGNGSKLGTPNFGCYIYIYWMSV